ncbi:MAG: amino acid adenylation domain-containing protein [Candidatus Aminicenantes bacterium]|nr:amino acid adenylation domain-containing protein [Candidatus Aminicenantes bacterium]NIM81998.1 amino acid adenylation domain-containing protein [Candidatus Aminicenantes bacterium]NIN21386.1 amino acid adenylation domain-containing protein [Candidatus Aminicenantes bacterium]NIN45207.1 amino acid adenylation domain-containing protein [Candidatus Aminicenantes bacterium]NIN88024.1 amino acid adenylation domain-containing protein [Candidatus Aminicenantes bacterium]
MIIERFEQKVTKHPDKKAVKTENGSLTYHELNSLSNRIAKKIKSISISKSKCSGNSDGRSKGNIGLLMEDARSMIASILGVLKAGYAYVPLVSDFPEKRIGFIMDHAEIEIFITDEANKDLASRMKSDISLIIIEDIANDTIDDTLVFKREVCSDSIAYLLYTSGSTGRPKAVQQTHRNILHFIDRYTENLDLTPEDKFTLFSSFSHDAAVMDIYTSLLNGASLFPLDLKKGGIFETLPQWLNNEKITVWHSVPTVYRYFVSSLAEAPDLPLLRYVVLGGEEVLRSDIEKFAIFFPRCWLYNLYGQTESTYNSGQFFEPGPGWVPGERVITLGDEVKGTEIVVVDEEGNEVEPLEVGEILVISEHVSPGYWKDEESSREKFTEDSFGKRVYFTGDLGQLLIDGKIEFLGREDLQVKVRGYRVELGEIENAVMQYDMVTQAAAVTVKNPSGEPFIAVYFAAEKNIHLESLRVLLQERLPNYMIPPYFRQLEKLPVTVSGKIDRKSLPALGLMLRTGYAAPGSDLEKRLVEIWSELLQVGKDVIGINNSFFELGGHSLKAVMFTSKIHREFKVQVPLAEVFARQTIKGLAEYIAQAKRKEYNGAAPVEQKEYYPASSVQKRLYSIRQLDTKGIAYNIPQFFRLGRYADRERLENTFKKLIQRHEILRTAFEVVDREPVQRIYNSNAVDFTLDYYETPPQEAQEVSRKFIAPFDLSRAPLFRAALVKLTGDGNYFILFDFHHIIVDNTSLNLLEADYLTLYEDVKLPGVRLHYKDYAQWQNSQYQREAVKRQGEYWLKLLAGELPVLELPYDYPRPSIQGFEGQTVSLILTEEETTALREVAKECDATVYMLLLSAFNVLLFRLSTREDIIVGTPMAARRYEDFQNIIGMFVNTLVLRNYPGGEKSFTGFLREVKRNTIAAYENQEYPFEDLVDSLPIQREAGRNPLFDTVFNLLDERAYQFEVSETNEAEALIYQTGMSKFDLTLTAIDREHQVVLRFEYSTQLFKPGTMERIIGYFRNILSGVQVNPQVRLSEIEILTEAEKERILEMSMGVETSLTRDKTIHELFEEQVERTPGGVALVGSMNKDGEPLQLTYKELKRKSGQLAQLLIEKGVQPGSIVGIVVERSIEMIIGILGILRAGGAYLPIDPGYPEERIHYMFSDSNARVLVSEVSKVSKVSEGTEVVSLSDLSEGFPTHLTHPTPPTHLCYIIYTSGTTGRPKGVLVSHQGLVNMVWFHREVFKEGPGSRISQVSSPAFDAMAFEVWPCLLGGAALYIVDDEARIVPRRLKEWLIRHRITISFQPTLMARALLQEQWPETGAALEVLRTAGDQLTHYPTRSLPFRFYNLYGPTEDTVWTTWTEIPVVDSSTKLNPPHIGKPVANKQVYILSKDLKLQPVGVVGELCISGDGTAMGYLNHPELTAEKFILAHGSWLIADRREKKVSSSGKLPMSYKLSAMSCLYKSGDLARWLEDGNIEFLGRVDNQVKIRGYRIELGEIEFQLQEIEAIKEAVVIDRERKSGERYLCAYVVTERPLDPGEVRKILGKRLPGYMVPSLFIPIEKIPLTPNGKVDKQALLALAAKVDPTADYITPKSKTEKIIARIWKKVLELDKVGVNDNFFEVGGTSLDIIEVAARINEDLNRDVPMVHVFQYPTISALAEYFDQEESKSGYIGDDRGEALERGKRDRMKKLQKRQGSKWVNNRI